MSKMGLLLKSRLPYRKFKSVLIHEPFSLSLKNMAYIFSLVLAVFLFSIFPLTDTDIWWHLACARETIAHGFLNQDPLTWTDARMPWVNVHAFFQLIVYGIYSVGKAPLLIAVKALLWGLVFFLFLLPAKQKNQENAQKTAYLFPLVIALFFIFILRYSLEWRPVLISLIFLGCYWNFLPKIFEPNKSTHQRIFYLATIIAIQFIWCRTQGLYILGPILAFLYFADSWRMRTSKMKWASVGLVAILFLMPLLHREGLALLLYPFGLLDRLVGVTSAATIFSHEIAENRSPISLLLAWENGWASLVAVIMAIVSLVGAIIALKRRTGERWRWLWLGISAILVLIAERNVVLLLPLFVASLFNIPFLQARTAHRTVIVTMFALSVVFLSFILGFWFRSLGAYNTQMISEERVPVQAASWMAKHPALRAGHLFNDDRSGGYLAWKLPQTKTYIDGRFILKTGFFFERYLHYARVPETFLRDAETQNITRVILPIRYYSQWDSLADALLQSANWNLVYRDDDYVIFDRK